jgi:hypothetical protein
MHAVVVGGGHLGRDGTFDDVADLLGHLGDLAARFQDQRRVGGDAVEQAEIVQLLDLLDVGGIDEKLHDGLLRIVRVSGGHARRWALL